MDVAAAKKVCSKRRVPKKSKAAAQQGKKPRSKRRRTDDTATENEACSLLQVPKHYQLRNRGDRNSVEPSASRSSSSDTEDQENNYNMVCSPFDAAKYTTGLSEYDSSCQDDVLQAPEYAADIFQRLYQAETATCPYPYMDRQHELNATMRMIVVDWLVEVHYKLRLEQATLYLCVNLLDRYLASTLVPRSRLQLVGITALFLACKYEETYPPSIQDCIYVSGKTYSHQDFLDTESHILFVLGFSLAAPTAFPFLQRFLSILGATPTMEIAAHYYMDHSLLSHELLTIRPSVVAAAAVCLAINHCCVRIYDGVDVKAAPGIVSGRNVTTSLVRIHHFL